MIFDLTARWKGGAKGKKRYKKTFLLRKRKGKKAIIENSLKSKNINHFRGKKISCLYLMLRSKSY
jgi:hypothetical protein